MGDRPIRTKAYTYSFNADSGGVVGAVLLTPQSEPTILSGEIVAVRAQVPTTNSRVLATLAISLRRAIASANMATACRLLYDSGTLTHGEIPTGGTVAVDLSESDSVARHNDSIGAERTGFTLVYGESVQISVSHTSAGGTGTNAVYIEVDYKELDA